MTKTFGEQYTAFGISQSGFIVPKGNVPSGLKVSWETGRVIRVTDNTFEALLPEIVANTTHIRNFTFGGNTISLPKKVGAQMGLLKSKGFIIKVEVIGVDRDLIVVGLGLAPD